MHIIGKMDISRGSDDDGLNNAAEDYDDDDDNDHNDLQFKQRRHRTDDTYK